MTIRQNTEFYVCALWQHPERLLWGRAQTRIPAVLLCVVECWALGCLVVCISEGILDQTARTPSARHHAHQDTNHFLRLQNIYERMTFLVEQHRLPTLQVFPPREQRQAGEQENILHGGLLMNMHSLHCSRIPKSIFFPPLHSSQFTRKQCTSRALLWPLTELLFLNCTWCQGISFPEALDQKQADGTVRSMKGGDLVHASPVTPCDNSWQKFVSGFYWQAD